MDLIKMFSRADKAAFSCLADMVRSLFRCFFMAWRVLAMTLATALLTFFLFTRVWSGFVLACTRCLRNLSEI